MKTKRTRTTGEKVTNLLIVAFVVLGTLFFAAATDIGKGSELMSKLFIAFLGAIITIQIIPGLILLGAMVKGVFSAARSTELTATAEPKEENRNP